MNKIDGNSKLFWVQGGKHLCTAGDIGSRGEHLARRKYNYLFVSTIVDTTKDSYLSIYNQHKTEEYFYDKNLKKTVIYKHYGFWRDTHEDIPVHSFETKGPLEYFIKPNEDDFVYIYNTGKKYKLYKTLEKFKKK